MPIFATHVPIQPVWVLFIWLIINSIRALIITTIDIVLALISWLLPHYSDQQSQTSIHNDGHTFYYHQIINANCHDSSELLIKSYWLYYSYTLISIDSVVFWGPSQYKDAVLPVYGFPW